MMKKLHMPSFFILFSAMLAIATLLFLLTKEVNPFEKSKNISVTPEISVIIDAGHGGEDGGAVGNKNVFEKDLNLSIALKIGNILEEKGVNVIYSRTEDILLYDRNVDYTNRKKALDLAARVKLANDNENAVFVSIHMNSFPQSQYKGLQVYYSKNDTRSIALAQAIQTSVKSQLQPQNNRKIIEATSRIYLLDRIQIPAVLIECGFLSNSEECRLLTTEIYQKQLSEIISEEIVKYIEKYS